MMPRGCPMRDIFLAISIVELEASSEDTIKRDESLVMNSSFISYYTSFKLLYN